MAQDSKKHHFVPAFYTSRWTGEDGKLVAWSRPHRSVVERRKHPEAVAWEKHLNSFEDLPEGTREWFEDHFLNRADPL